MGGVSAEGASQSLKGCCAHRAREGPLLGSGCEVQDPQWWVGSARERLQSCPLRAGSRVAVQCGSDWRCGCCRGQEEVLVSGCLQGMCDFVYSSAEGALAGAHSG